MQYNFISKIIALIFKKKRVINSLEGCGELHFKSKFLALRQGITIRLRQAKQTHYRALKWLIQAITEGFIMISTTVRHWKKTILLPKDLRFNLKCYAEFK